MNPKLLELTPTRYLCPICGKWHRWKHSDPLEYYDSDRPAVFSDEDLYPKDCAVEAYTIYVDEDYLHYSTKKRMCHTAGFKLGGKISIDSIKEDDNRHIVTFDVDFISRNKLGKTECNCSFVEECNLVKLFSDQGDHLHFKIPLGFEFDQDEYYAIIPRRPSKKYNKNREDTTMANNNIFNLNLEFGPNKDENIASTLMGVAVKNGDSWRIYDKMKNEITDVGDMKIGDLPIFIIPSTKIAEGDLIKDDGEYYFVTKVATVNSPTQTISVRTGEIKSAVPIKNILGFRFYSKVVALGDSLNMGDDFDVEKLAIMSAMFSQTGNSGNNLLPLILFKDKLGGDDDTMKLVLMSSMTGGNMAGFDNSLMSYLMLDSFIGKKDGEAPQTGDGAAE